MPKINPYLLLIVFSLILFLPGIQNVPVIDRDEAHFAQASRQMLQSGEYFQIRFQEKTRFQKPPGINWLQAGAVKLLSDADSSTIWPYRLPSVIGALLSVLFIYMFASRFIDRRSALMGAAFLASALLLVVESHMAVIDASLLSSVVLMQGALWMIYDPRGTQKQAHWLWAILFWLAMAYGFVLKGVTPLVGVLTTVALCLVDRRIKWLKGLHIFWGLGLFCLLSITWLLFVNEAENSNYLMQMIHKDLLPKLQGGHESHGQPPLFHLAILPLTLWPASLFLWQGGVYAFKKRHQKTVKFLLAWILPTWIFFEIMPTKLPQYVLPTFPAICLLMALALNPKEKVFKASRLLHVLQFLWGILTIGLAFALLFLPYLVMQHFTLTGILLFWILSILGCCCVYFAWQEKYRRAVYSALIAAVLAYPIIYSILLPQLKPLWTSKNIVQSIDKRRVSSSSPLLAVGYSEPSLVMFLNTKNVLYTNIDNALAQMDNNPRQLLLIDEESYNKIPKHQVLNVIFRTQGFNYSKGKWVNLLIVERLRKD